MQRCHRKCHTCQSLIQPLAYSNNSANSTFDDLVFRYHFSKASHLLTKVPLVYTTNTKSLNNTPNCKNTIKLDKSYRLLSGHQEGLVLRSILTWAASYFISNDHLRLLLIQRCDARFLLFLDDNALSFFRVTLRA